MVWSPSYERSSVKFDVPKCFLLITFEDCIEVVGDILSKALGMMPASCFSLNEFNVLLSNPPEKQKRLDAT